MGLISGDVIHFSHLPRLLKEKGFDQVDVEINTKGLHLLRNNPFIDNIYYYEPALNLKEWANINLVKHHWQTVSRGYDKFINLYHSLENGVIAMENEPIYYMHESARAHWREINYNDQSTLWAGYDDMGRTGEIYFSSQEHDIVVKWLKRFEGKFKVMINLSGTTIHKRLVNAEEIVTHIINTYPDAIIITTGDAQYKQIDFTDFPADRVESIVGRFDFPQALLIARYIDCMISMESGIAVGSNMWGTPTIQMLTSSSLINHCKYAKNDFSIQSPARCSPCNKGPYRYIGCPSKEKFPLCVFFELDKVKDNIHEIYQGYRNQRFPVSDRFPGRNDAKMPVVHNGPANSGTRTCF